MNFDDLLDPQPYRWPKKNDLPFRKAKRPDSAGPLARDGVTRAVSVMEGFMLAGAALADQAIKEKFQRYDWVYPMLFCYRHAIEVWLKWLIAQYGPELDVKPEDLNDNHDLWLLWKNCHLMFRACSDNADDEAVKAVGKVVKQFHDWDKGGTAFRYATAKSGAVVEYPIANIDIENPKDVMVGVRSFFTGSDGWFNSVANV